MSLRPRWVAAAAALVLVVSPVSVPAQAALAAPPSITLGAGETALIRFRLAGEDALRRLVAQGADLAARPRTQQGAVLVDMVVDDQQFAALTGQGAVPVQVIQRESYRIASNIAYALEHPEVEDHSECGEVATLLRQAIERNASRL